MAGESNTALPSFDGLLRSLAVASLGGFPAGLIAGGVGSRLAMRIVAITAGSADQGAITEAEATVGDITAGGTLFLLLLGAFAGVVGGLVYMAARRWLADAGPWKGLLFGFVLLALFGSLIIEGDNFDFHRFGYPALNITLFATLFVVFALLVAPLIDRVERLAWLRPIESSGPASLGVQALGLILLLPAIASLGILADGAALVLLPYMLIALPVTAALIVRVTGRFDRLSDLRTHRRALIVALVVLAAPLVAGTFLDTIALVDIFRASA